MNLYLIDIIAIITALSLLSLSLFQFTYNRGQRLSNIILGYFLLANALYVLSFLYFKVDRFIPDWMIYLGYFGISCGYMFGPLLFFYATVITSKQIRFDSKVLVHLIPFIISIIFLSLRVKHFLVYSFILMHVQIFVYLIASLRRLRTYSVDLKKYYSSVEKISTHRIEIVLFVFIVMWLIEIANFFIFVFFTSIPHGQYKILETLALTVNFIFALLFVYYNMKNPLVTITLSNNNRKRYEKSKLTAEKKEEYLAKLKNYLDSEKPFLTPSITLNDLSEYLDIPSRDLSQVINESFKMNFYDLINTRRVEEAKKMLKSSNNKTILEILYQSGFNSKSTFNAVFKKCTGITPTEYKANADSSNI